MNTMRELRMWHWRQAVAQRQKQRMMEDAAAHIRRPFTDGGRSRHREYTEAAQGFRDCADLHLSAVQVLNESLEGTAEQDCREADGMLQFAADSEGGDHD